MDSDEQRKIGNDIKYILKIYKNILDISPYIFKMQNEIGANAESLNTDSDREIVLSALDAMDNIINYMEQIAQMLDGYISPSFVINDDLYNKLTYREFIKLRDSVKKTYLDYRDNYDYAYKVYTQGSDAGIYRPMKYISHV